ncbi:hypothetical protein PBY51_012352 [Eleginops maclovinus]|uniref:Uncharacterized protein n=1 Tax=Eleginops maclovinus TaxID=56733 RepID=A0AAN8AMA7_ELEMC|nr:hypothetical protein PBY51_012352 [Eleginops maclovinus]
MSLVSAIAPSLSLAITPLHLAPLSHHFPHLSSLNKSPPTPLLLRCSFHSRSFPPNLITLALECSPIASPPHLPCCWLFKQQPPPITHHPTSRAAPPPPLGEAPSQAALYRMLPL